MLTFLALLACSAKPADDAFTTGEVEDPGTPLDSADTSDDTADTTDTGGGYDTGGDTDTGGGNDTGGGTDTAAPVVGTWGMLQSTRSLVDNPVGSGTDTTDTRAVSLLRWTRTGTDIVWESELCALTSTEVYGTLTSFPPAFLAAFPVLEREATLSAAETGATFTAGPFVDVIGARLDSPDDPLPTSERDSRQWDQDGDGEPGMTVHVEQSILGGGDVYITQRTSSTLVGTVLRADRIEGFVRDFDQEQVLYGASTWWLELPTNNRPDTTEDANWFILQELGDDVSDCTALVAAQRGVFGR